MRIETINMYVREIGIHTINIHIHILDQEGEYNGMEAFNISNPNNNYVFVLNNGDERIQNSMTWQ